MLDDLLESLDKVDIPATVYRTAVRLLRQADENSMCVLSYEAARELVGTESDGTVRAHLHQLHSIGVLWFRRNEVIRVGFYAQPARAERAKRAPSQQLNTNTGRLVGRQDLEPTYLPEGGAGETATQTEPDLPPEQQRTFALLTDAEFGMDAPTAMRLAQQFRFDAVLAHAFSVLDDVRSGKVRSVYVLPARLKRGGQPQITPDDRLTGLWLRHGAGGGNVEVDVGDGLTAEERRRKYSLE